MKVFTQFLLACLLTFVTVLWWGQDLLLVPHSEENNLLWSFLPTNTTHLHPQPVKLHTLSSTASLALKPFDLSPEHAMDPVEDFAWTREQVAQNEPLLFFVTPTHFHPAQWVDFVRLSQTLIHFRHFIYWVVVEDSSHCTKRLRAWLDHLQFRYAHIHRESPRGRTENKHNHRGVNQRNAALDHIEKMNVTGVVYFGDSDNAYSLLLFNELMKTQRVSIFGVGFSGQSIYERCHVNPTTGKVDKIFGWGKRNRKYKMDMAGFAFHTSILNERRPRFSHDWKRGLLESNFLGLLINKMSELEPLANNCTSIYTWHVKTNQVNVKEPFGNDTEYFALKNLV